MVNRACLLACVLALVTCAASSGAASPTPPPAPFRTEQFDCEDAFDLVAMAVMLRCATYRAPPQADAKIDAALARLRRIDADARAGPGVVHIRFCPLSGATGIVPGPGELYLDDGLIALSADGLAEIIAHELVHVRQFEELGRRGFKCDYVRAMFGCGGCQDRRHRLEREAYAEQDRVRERLLRESSRERRP